ncbi:hypothetical protein RND71_005291 [Anisodus tanguticus]|uniref:Uncharacterized protein n=1 Tax=Anisodus tanguticus TaxID=243964 RepID=A0AAE1SRL5_9SOLA|nr:hypothetical protein RND71_005291 [Anisodus tanguticus]
MTPTKRRYKGKKIKEFLCFVIRFGAFMAALRCFLGGFDGGRESIVSWRLMVAMEVRRWSSHGVSGCLVEEKTGEDAI